MKNILRIIALVFIPLITALCTYLFLQNIFFSPIDENDTSMKYVIISTDYDQISNELGKAGLIKSPKVFSYLLKLRLLKSNIVPGEYALSRSMSPFDIAKKVNTGDVVFRKVKISGGDDVETVAGKIKEQEIIDEETLNNFIQNKEAIMKLNPALSFGTFEGFLFPATYTFTRPISAEKVFSTFVENANKHWYQHYDERAKNLNFDRNKIIILASVIEREASILNVPKDFKTLQDMADVYYTKLEKGMHLNAMGPLYYVKKDTSFPPSEEDKKFDNPYNTFLYEGLPPTAICNPSGNTIKATLYPSAQGYTSFNVNIKSRIISFNKEE